MRESNYTESIDNKVSSSMKQTELGEEVEDFEEDEMVEDDDEIVDSIPNDEVVDDDEDEVADSVPADEIEDDEEVGEEIEDEYF